MSPTPPRQPGAGAARHAPFKVHKDSHIIHKAAAAASPPSSSSTNSSVSSSTNAAITSNAHHRPPAPRKKHPQPQQPQQQQPVIIYTHSPKVIRTNPRDFMSIVQKLTGLDSPGSGRAASSPAAARINAGPIAAAAAAQDESSSSSSESCANAAHAAGAHPYADAQLMPPPAAPLDAAAHFMAAGDIPLFAPPDASELHQQLCAPPRGIYGGQFPPPVVDTAAALGPVMATTTVNGAGSNGGAVFSPSMVEAMRTFHQDYN